ncbi:MAG: LysM peptidoglycan-binding domain-containing protein [Deltaproteobacteria bacterium]|nr:LysM peptidoglycan-binding domain-containing protein [Deltaproteobacteria bacterium]MBW2052391.1 LysM peptidoglycan-binding domain-containing protein [Deltaproteobacteria bacterium]MBW2140984.1 LysM peptidoglycan-binding domain-containing protein [Deltaproteobacteria bacterium]MBW2323153.1 LysM peptidoglycan-binding domain-containing protein [Deltaproteobacteria bacterium]
MKKTASFFVVITLFILVNGCGVPESDYKQLESELAALKVELTQTQNEINSLSKDLTARQKENESLKSQLDKYKVEVKRLKAMASSRPGSAEKQTSAKKPRIYKVKPGDTLWGISRTTGVSVDELKKANNIKGNDLSVGQELLLP